MAKPNLLLLAVLVAAAALASGCAPALQVPDQVKVEVAVPCVDPQDVPARPQLRSEDELKALDRYKRTLASWSDLLQLQAYTARLEAIAASCSRIPNQSAPAQAGR